ncbi:chemotaxis protein CheR [Phaeobacter sp. QD34_3]|uniref:CheR family methyltransferase n=1 Tax=unclassified Phaeobacter TaxID=2621772 RepID=UPI00237FCC1F|nr:MULTISPECIES: CheR family methyltransferase [unclassified Phaeobacter]MDE4133896.1 chemotaxis protein CheR [Phaeobacter sp. QD34_3]MDE4137647.1 chemotaxis protein CheR [Phaeobacter sp. QD34_24]
MNLAAPPIHSPMVEPSADQCRILVERAFAASGVKINPGKTEFIHLRVSRRLNALGLDGYDAYMDLLDADTAGSELRCLVEALTTHTTSFFRERHQYDWLVREGLERIGERGAGFERPLTVWSAACSTGAELWSAAMVLEDAARSPGGLRKYQLIGTDISRPVLKKAKGATYSAIEIEGVAPAQRQRYLMRSRTATDLERRPYYRIVPELRERATFEWANLSNLVGVRDFGADIAFLRNVLIYFPEDVQERVLSAVVGRLRPGGILFTGHAEAVSPRAGLRSIGPSIYEKV